MKFCARILLKVLLFLMIILGSNATLLAQVWDNDGNYVTAKISKLEIGQNNGTQSILVTLGAISKGTTPPSSHGSYASGGGPMLRINYNYTTDSDIRKILISVIQSAMSTGSEVEFRYWGITQSYAIVAARIPGN